MQLLSKCMKFWTTVRLRIVVPTTYHTQKTEKLPHKQGTLGGPNRMQTLKTNISEIPEQLRYTMRVTAVN